MIRSASVRISVAFIILAQAGCQTDQTVDPAVATSLLANPGWSISAVAGSPVPVPPSVTVTDQRGAGIGGVTVTFAVSSGGGSVSGASAVTSKSGLATVGAWVLGPSTGPNILTASVSGLPPVTFQATATAIVTVCGQTVDTYLVGTTIGGTLASTDCYSDGTYYDPFMMRVDSADAYSFTQSAVFETYLSLWYPNGQYIADNLTFGANPTMKVLLPPGFYVISASSSVFDQTGAYSLSSAKTHADVTGCERVYAVRGTTTIQNVQSTDCVPANGAGYADEFIIYVRRGSSLTVSMTSETIDSYLELYFVAYTGARTFVGSNDNGGESGTKNARLAYTSDNDGFFAIVARTNVAGQTGSYTLNIQ